MSSSNDDLLPQAAPQSSGSQQSNSSKSSRGPRPRLFLKDRCQADQCSTSDLSKLRFYNRRNHICLQHQKVDQYSRRGQIVRFCQRCAVAHSLEEFDGAKRSCRQKLEKFNSRRRKATTIATTATTNPLPVVNPSHSNSVLSEDPSSGLSSELQDLDSIDLGFDIADLLQPELDLDLLLADAAPAPAAAATAAPAAEAVPMSAANSINCNERVCCTTMDAECICCQSSEQQQQQQQQQHADGAHDDLASSSGAAAAAADDDVPTTLTSSTATSSTPAATPTDCDDPNACVAELNKIATTLAAAEEAVAAVAPTTPSAQVIAAASAAKLEAEFAALQATDAAMYAMIVHQQMMQARLLLTTTANALLMQRARSGSLSSLDFSRKESFGEINHMVM